MVKEKKPDGNIHVIPDYDLEEHIEHESCFCLPDWDIKNKKEYLRGEAEVKVFIHNRVIDSLQ